MTNGLDGEHGGRHDRTAVSRPARGSDSESLQPVNADYQWKVWIRGEYPREGYYDDLTLTINILYDLLVLPQPNDLLEESVGPPNETLAFQRLSDILDPMIEEFGARPDIDYLTDPRWPAVRAAAKYTLDVMTGADSPLGDEAGK